MQDGGRDDLRNGRKRIVADGERLVLAAGRQHVDDALEEILIVDLCAAELDHPPDVGDDGHGRQHGKNPKDDVFRQNHRSPPFLEMRSRRLDASAAAGTSLASTRRRMLTAWRFLPRLSYSSARRRAARENAARASSE